MNVHRRVVVAPGTMGRSMRGKGCIALFLTTCLFLAGSHGAAEPRQPAGEMRGALYVTLSPAWFDPVEEGAEHHWRAVSHFKRLVLLKVPESATRMAMLRAGSVYVTHGR